MMLIYRLVIIVVYISMTKGHILLYRIEKICLDKKKEIIRLREFNMLPGNIYIYDVNSSISFGVYLSVT